MIGGDKQFLHRRGLVLVPRLNGGGGRDEDAGSASPNEKGPPDSGSGEPFRSFPKSSGPGSRHQKQPELRQHFLKRNPEPHGQRSFLPSFSVNSLLPWTILTPLFTLVSDGNPLRRLLIVSKKMAVGRGLAGSWDTAFHIFGATIPPMDTFL
jgi:hypothetical protein